MDDVLLSQFEDGFRAHFRDLSQRIEALQKLQISNNRALHRRETAQPGGRRNVVRAGVLNFVSSERPDLAVKHCYPDLVKATSNPARTDVAGWATELTVEDGVDFLLAGSAPSLFARLLSSGFDIGGVGRPVSVPYRVPGTFVGGWVSEASAAPIEQLRFGSVKPSIGKLVSMSTFSNELRRRSVPTIERILDAQLPG
ncbi:hypothetical protein GF108_06820 [Phyllobacterium sp. SYP-B3895]|uniref:hypothetical protein n=1 Tax=Phyllobacterium sp. SYP-B3895 TaxID=2663240 RepID=UPI0012997CE0|nr:hypothetical protein [Phyllobacterium sp. SYP-B3895]MRG55295.1 hypothetical protein [Phyllobacterium sp. SYP-B3895]